ncbi:hypothetical protein BT93_B0342 [Corymbia citriodora subsp. variegata]|nr:hypothetical protein BT93_B0342 [Corymbia citriodora subsp. variegata]
MADRGPSPDGKQRAPPHSAADDHRRIFGFYRGILPGVTGSIATGATYFGFIESAKKWIEESNPHLGGHWSHFFAGALGDTLGSFVYVPCEVMKQRMQVQGNKSSWRSVVQKERVTLKSNVPMYGYYNGMFQAGFSIWKEQGLRGLYAGFWSTLARDVPLAGLLIMSYEALKDMTEYSKQILVSESNLHLSSTVEGLALGGLAGGFSAYLTTPLDVIKTRLQVQGSATRYNGWFDAIRSIWVTWYIPASALSFMAVEFLRDHFNEELDDNTAQEVSTLSIDKSGSLTEVA